MYSLLRSTCRSHPSSNDQYYPAHGNVGLIYSMDNLLGIYEKALPKDISWEERFIRAKEAGFDFIEISVDKDRLNKLEYTEEEISSLLFLAEEYAMPFHTLTLSANRYFPIGDPEKRDEGIELIRKAIRLAKKLKVEIIQLTAYDVYQKPSTEETKRLYEEAIREVLAYDEDYGIILAIEVLEDVPHFNTSKKLGDFIRKIDHPLLKEYGDTGNIVYNGYDPLQDLHDGADIMAALHVKDAVFHNEHNVAYGEGLVDFTSVFAYLKEVHYSGYLVSECWDEENYHPELRNISEFIRRYMK